MDKEKINQVIDYIDSLLQKIKSEVVKVDKEKINQVIDYLNSLSHKAKDVVTKSAATKNDASKSVTAKTEEVKKAVKMDEEEIRRIIDFVVYLAHSLVDIVVHAKHLSDKEGSDKTNDNDNTPEIIAKILHIIIDVLQKLSYSITANANKSNKS